MEDKVLRILIKSFGWGGPVFGIALEELKNEEDFSNEINGIHVVVEKEILKQYNGFKIDYLDGWFNKGFRIIPGAGGSSCA
jgi:iron-sulfur cluster assembly protein